MPENSSQTVVWSSSNESVVSVSAEGLVHAADNGKAYVTAVTEDGTLQASCRVIVETVHEHVWDKGKVTKQPDCKNTGAKTYTCTDCGEIKTEEIPADKNRHSFGGHSVTKKPTLRLNVSSLTMQVKQKTSGVKVSGLAAGDSVKSWKSSNTRVVKVDRKGKLAAQSRTGKATVTVTLASGKKGSFRVTVQKGRVSTSRLTGVPKRLTVQKGKSYTLKPVRSPFTAQDKITYSSSNKKVATVSSKGKITAKKGRQYKHYCQVRKKESGCKNHGSKNTDQNAQ